MSVDLSWFPRADDRRRTRTSDKYSLIILRKRNRVAQNDRRRRDRKQRRTRSVYRYIILLYHVRVPRMGGIGYAYNYVIVDNKAGQSHLGTKERARI